MTCRTAKASADFVGYLWRREARRSRTPETRSGRRLETALRLLRSHERMQGLLETAYRDELAHHCQPEYEEVLR